MKCSGLRTTSTAASPAQDETPRAVAFTGYAALCHSERSRGTAAIAPRRARTREGWRICERVQVPHEMAFRERSIEVELLTGYNGKRYSRHATL
jgi:hypothetical protein